jgi:4-hydroxybenzoate polyprenyltransferase
MIDQADNDAIRRPACVECGHVDSPINLGPGPGWLAVILWASAAAFWTLGMALQILWVGYLAAPVFLAALIYTLWYFYRREKACRHCGARWTPGSP